MLALDVLSDILLTLDVKDILICKSVCKSWYSFISSPFFVNLHLEFVRNNEDKSNKQLGNRRIYAGHCYISNIQGSSNGLVCISSIINSKICLSNPSTRLFRIVQEPIILPNSISGWRALCYGFGYDSSTDDYKLVMAIDKGSDGTLVQILSLKSDVWKLFGHVNYGLYNINPGILLNGALHWFWLDSNYTKKKVIMSFDLAKEEFKEIPQPDDSRYNARYVTRLGIFEDHLCIFHALPDGRPSHIWVMKNYNVKHSWELLPTFCELKDRVHYMNKDCRLSRETMSYFCCDAFLSSVGRWMSDPIFLQTLVSPYVNDNERHKKLNEGKNKEIDDSRNQGRGRKEEENEEQKQFRALIRV